MKCCDLQLPVIAKNASNTCFYDETHRQCLYTDPAVVKLLCFNDNSATFLPLDASVGAAHTEQM